MFEKLRLSIANKLVPPAVKKRGFYFGQLNRLTADWISTSQAIQFDISQGLRVMRTRARDLYQNDPIAKKFVALARKNIVGPDGFTLKVKSYDIVRKDGGGSEQKLDTFANRVIQDKFWYWSKKKTCNITGQMSFRELCDLMVSNVVFDGEVFLVHLKGKEYGGDSGYTTQLLDPNLIDETLNKRLPNGNYIHMGIEYDQYRRPVKYYIRKTNPFDELWGGYNSWSYEYDEILAENVTHLYVKEFINQGRGIPWFAPVALRLHYLNKTSEAAMINFRVGASKTLALKQTEMVDPNIEKAGEETDSKGNILEGVEPGEVYKVPFGYEPFDYNPQYPNGEFGIFVESIMQQIASGLDTAHPSLSSSYRGTTWTSSRTALIDERDGWRRLQAWFIEHMLDDIYANWLYMGLLSNYIKLPAMKFNKFNEPYWYGRKWAWVDPEKEENARIKQLQYRFKTFTEILAEDNKDLEEHLEELAAEREMFTKYGIEFPSDIPIDPVEDKPEEVDQSGVAAVPVNSNGKK